MENPEVWFQRGIAYQKEKRLIEAIACYRCAAESSHAHDITHYNLALALQESGQEEEAIGCYRRAVEINPQLAEAHNNLGNIYQLKNDLEQARLSYEKALVIKPGLTQAEFNLGLVLKKQGKWALALDHFRRSWELAPNYYEAWDNYRLTLAKLKRTEEWVESFSLFNPGDPPPILYLLAGLGVCRYLPDFSREKYFLHKIVNYEFCAQEVDLLSEILGLIQYFDLAQQDIFNLYSRHSKLVSESYVPDLPLLPPLRTYGSKVRVGYMSPDFRMHVMGKLMYEVLLRHNQNQFEIYLYSTCHSNEEDEWTTKYKAICHNFTSLSDIDEKRAAQIIARDDLDILVDLAGLTSTRKVGILAYKPARIQITHLGYHGAVGLATVDYKITDPYADLPGNQTYLIEKLLPKEGCVLPFRHVEPAPTPLSRRVLNIAEDVIVFGVFVNILKLSPRCLLVWKKILDRLRGGVLAFSPANNNDKESYLRRIAAAGIAKESVVFISMSPDEHRNRSRYELIDIALDTFPYSGGDTTLAALDSGVPVVTLCGVRHSERMSFSILMNLGITSTIAYDEAEYIETALRLAQEKDFRAAMVLEIRERLRSSVLTEMASYTRSLENSYQYALSENAISVDAGGRLTARALTALLQSAILMHQQGKLEDAQSLYLELLSDQPDHPVACYLYGMLLKENGNLTAALEKIQKAVLTYPNYAAAHQSLGNLYLEEKLPQEAIVQFQAALAITPESPSALKGLGLALIQADRLAEAVMPLKSAGAMDLHDASIPFNLGIVLQKQGHLEAASAAYSRALAIIPDYMEVYFNLGGIFRDREQWEQSAACYKSALKLAPNNGDIYYQLGAVLFSAGKISEWLINFKQFTQSVAPSFEMMLYGLRAYHYLGEYEQGRACLEVLLAGKYQAERAQEAVEQFEEFLSLVLYFDVEEAALYQLYRRYNKLSKQLYLPIKLHAQSLLVNRKVRIGYLSADFKDHVMGKMIYEIVSRHDKKSFEIFCYALSRQEDEWTRKFRDASDKFSHILDMGELAAAQYIANDKIDILVDLATHTKGAMPGILAQKPATIQITHIASCGAVGLEAVDFKLTDQFCDTQESPQYLIETLLPMQGCVVPYRKISAAPHHHYQREHFGLKPDEILLGVFVNIFKLSLRCMKLWRRVLDEIPAAKLVFSPFQQEARDAYTRVAGAAGIEAERVVFVPASSDEAQNIARYAMIDISLDPLPYGGVNVTLESLEMGVPVVTLCGKRHGERTSYSILMNLGVPHTVAHTEDEYVHIAAKLAKNTSFHAEVVSHIRTGMNNSVLVDMDSHTRHLEAVYRQALGAKHHEV